jgi:drug/metabolite transporter (DMT)-like permease
MMEPKREMLAIGFFILYLLISTGGLTLIKLGSAGNAFSLDGAISLRLNYRFLIGFFMYIVSFLMFTVILSRMNLSLFSPLAGGMAMVLNVVVGVLILEEKLSVQQLVGVVIVIVGVFIINWKRG